MNNLKLINDEYGHDLGDLAIMEAVRLICQTFKRSPVYRVGGDEFVVLLERQDLEQSKALLTEYGEKAVAVCARTEGMPCPEMAYGVAMYDAKSDKNFQQIFKRTDEAMYLKKQEMKRKRKDEGTRQ